MSDETPRPPTPKRAPAPPTPGSTPTPRPQSAQRPASGSPANPVRPQAPRPATAKPASAKPAPTARPARPAAPVRPAAGPRLEGVLEEEQQVQSIESVIPSGLSASTYLPSARRSSDLDPRQRLRRRMDALQTLLPSALTLCVSLLLLAGGWFLLDQDSLLRTNALGRSIPLVMAAVAVVMGVLSAWLMGRYRTLHQQLQSMSEN